MRTDNIAMLEDTLSILEQGWYRVEDKQVPLKLSRDQMEAAQVYLPDDVANVCESRDFDHIHVMGRCGYGCENKDSFSLARERCSQFSYDLDQAGAKPILVLNLANPVHPGGGVRRGAQAQEEDLCRKSSLLVSLESRNAAPYYAYNRSLATAMGSDAIIIHPQVEIIKDETGALLDDTVIVAVMTCAAPVLWQSLEGLTQDQYQALVLHRITGMLKLAAHEGYRYLVLGAFGCGAFGNDARIVSDLSYKALQDFDLGGHFRRVDFAVLDHSRDQYNYKEFCRNFDHFYRDEDQKEIDKEIRPMTMKESANQPMIFFWKDTEENGYLSNWYRRSFVVNDFEYLHVEQYMMAQKAKLFHDSATYTAILRATEPWECKALGKKVTPFDAQAWNAVKYEVVKAGNRAKFAQNPDLLHQLLATGTAVLAEASPKDRIWGIGLDAAAAAKTAMEDWPGQGLLGKALMELREEFAQAAPSGTQIRLVRGDITKVNDVEAIVNAANKSLLGGGGVDGAIHRAAGPGLYEECRGLGGCRTGQAKITGAYDLPSHYVIHTVGPVWHGGKGQEADLLAACYRNSLQIAVDKGIRTIAFPSISTGIYSYPVDQAADIAVATAQRFIDDHPGALDLVEWVLFDGQTYDAYDAALTRLQAARTAH